MLSATCYGSRVRFINKTFRSRKLRSRPEGILDVPQHAFRCSLSSASEVKPQKLYQSTWRFPCSSTCSSSSRSRLRDGNRNVWRVRNDSNHDGGLLQPGGPPGQSCAAVGTDETLQHKVFGRLGGRHEKRSQKPDLHFRSRNGAAAGMAMGRARNGRGCSRRPQ
jgi:hypothetical protein